MTLNEAKKIYAAIGGSMDITDDTWGYIRSELEQVVKASGPRKAGELIEWWGCWDERDTATKCAKEIRKFWAEMKRGKA
jgi:hypothetical protein